MPLRICLLFVLLAACGPKKFPRPNFDDIDFATTESAKLFFKNVRSYYYEADLYSFSGAEVYRWRGRNTDSTAHWLQPVLVIHLSNNQVFLLSENSMALKNQCLPYLYRQTGNTTDSLSILPGSMDDHLAIHVFVYDAIETEAQLYFKNEAGETIAFLESDKLRQDYHKQVRDFLRLLGRI